MIKTYEEIGKLRGIGYDMRDDLLKLMGFRCYNDYLQSDLWAWIRERLGKQPYASMCWCCSASIGLVWHHADYRMPVLVGNFSNSEKDRDIYRLCNECHSAIHFTFTKNNFIELSEANRRMLILRNAFDSFQGGPVDRKVELQDHDEKWDSFVDELAAMKSKHSDSGSEF